MKHIKNMLKVIFLKIKAGIYRTSVGSVSKIKVFKIADSTLRGEVDETVVLNLGIQLLTLLKLFNNRKVIGSNLVSHALY